MKKAILLVSFVAIAAMLLNILPCNATVWRVNNNPNYIQGCSHCFSSLQAANDTSIVMAGDTVHLEASVIPYSATTINKQITILGPGYFLNQNPGFQKNVYSASVLRIIFSTGSDNSLISGIYVGQSGNSSSIQINNANYIYIDRTQTRDDITFAAGSINAFIIVTKSFIGGRIITGGNNSSVYDINVSNSYIHENISLTSSSTSNYGTITQCVLNNFVNINDGFNFFNNIIVNSTNFSQNNNTIANIYTNLFIPTVPAFLTGGTNVNEPLLSTVFPSTGSQDSILNVNPIGICPQCYTGFPGNYTLGMFGGASPYKLSGIPNIPSIYQLQSPLDTLQGVIINVNLSTRSNDSIQSQIVEVEYFWDVDLGFNNQSDTLFANPVTVITNGILYVDVPLNLGLGTHILFVRSKDTEGRWSHTNYVDSIAVTGTVNIADLTFQTGINIYPNPFTDEITIKPTNNETVRLIVYSVEGKKVIDKLINQTSQIETQALTSGTYILSIVTNKEKIYRATIIKE